VNKDDLILISVDDHISEPADMFDAHVPAKYKEHAPSVVELENGEQQWFYGEIRGRNLGLNAVAGKPREMYNLDATRYDEMRPGCWDVHERVRDMNAGGQLAGLNFPNFTGFSGQVLNQGPDRELNLVMIKAYNDWHVDEWCGAYPGRFIPAGILPLFDVEEAAKELRRLASKGCLAAVFSENPEALGMPSIHSGAWHSLFEAACEEGTVLCCHLGSSSRQASVSPDAPPSVIITSAPVMTVSTLLELLWADFWRDFPDLRFSLTEGDIGWIPFFLWKAEHVLDVQGGWTKHQFPPGYDGPIDVFKRHIYTCFINDKVGPQLMDWFNVDHVFWESDYPHSDSTWPNSPEEVIETIGHLDDELINKITHENAMAAYRFDPFEHRPREDCTVGALRSLATDVDTTTTVGRYADERDLAIWNRTEWSAKKESTEA
jgi:predicted TIM-barrel fold metal-dependent hydrolase